MPAAITTFKNDDALSSSTSPGAAVLPEIQSTAANGQGLLLTIPMNGYVSADRNGGGDVRYNNNTYDPSDNGWIDGYAQSRIIFRSACPEFPAKPGGSGELQPLRPAPQSDAVYEDEFVKLGESSGRFEQPTGLRNDLDNEPDLWSSRRMQKCIRTTATYQEIIQSQHRLCDCDQGGLTKKGLILRSGVNYGWQGYVDLQRPERSRASSDTILNFQAYALSFRTIKRK